MMFAPHGEFPLHQTRSFMHPSQTVVTLATPVRQYGWVDALAIVAYAQAEHALAVADVDFNPLRVCVPERVAKCFGGDAIHIVVDQRREISRSAFNLYGAHGRDSAALIACELLGERADRPAEVIAGQGG